jgi:hypothetical protein
MEGSMEENMKKDRKKINDVRNNKPTLNEAS